MPTIVPLSASKVALIDDLDAERVLAHKWSYHGEGYACRGVHYYIDGKRHTRLVMLHRFIVNAPVGMDVDHKDGNGLDCRRDNIRVATRVQNIANTGPRPGRASQYKGVQRRKSGRWFASIVLDGKTFCLGTFDREEDAAMRYDDAAINAWGEFAYLNFPYRYRIPQSGLALAGRGYFPQVPSTQPVNIASHEYRNLPTENLDTALIPT